MNRRRFLRLGAGGVVATVLTALPAIASAQRIEIRASKFQFAPSEIAVVLGRPVTLTVTSSDFAHGFALPDFGVRSDLIPGRTVEIAITPAIEGRFHYLCDNFCGEGHDRMSGILVVKAA